MNLNEFERTQIAYNKMQLIKYDTKKIIQEFNKILNEKKEEVLKIYEIEKKYNDLENIDNIFKIDNQEKKVKKEIEQRKRNDDFIISRYMESIGIIGVIFDGDIYVLIDLLKKMICTQNAMIFCTNNRLYAISNLIVLYFKQALKICNYDEDIVQLINSDEYSEMYKHNNILNKIIVVGNKFLQNQVISKSNIEVITSGYGHFDVYIEDILDLELIKNILDIKNIELTVYVNKNIESELIEEMSIIDFTEVEDIDECIRDININSAGYSSSIFTKNSANANKFLRLVKSKNVFVNASPTVERALDISENDLLYIKQTMYKN